MTTARELTADERAELLQRQQRLEDASDEGWLSADHRQARAALVALVRMHADSGVALSSLAGALGVSRQRAHQLTGPDPRSKAPV